jgi:hypothetical protein
MTGPVTAKPTFLAVCELFEVVFISLAGHHFGDMVVEHFVHEIFLKGIMRGYCGYLLVAGGHSIELMGLIWDADSDGNVEDNNVGDDEGDDEGDGEYATGNGDGSWDGDNDTDAEVDVEADNDVIHDGGGAGGYGGEKEFESSAIIVGS